MMDVLLECVSVEGRDLAADPPRSLCLTLPAAHAPWVVGRTPQAEFFAQLVPDQELRSVISRNHFELAWAGAVLCVRRLSPNALVVDGAHVPPHQRVPVAPGATIGLCGSDGRAVLLAFRVRPRAAATGPAAGAAAAPAATPWHLAAAAEPAAAGSPRRDAPRAVSEPAWAGAAADGPRRGPARRELPTREHVRQAKELDHARLREHAGRTMLEPVAELAPGGGAPPSPELARFTFQAEHPRWEGMVTLTRDGKFHRESGLLFPGDAGSWSAEDGALHLCWDDWEPEVLRSGDGGLSFADAKGFTLTAERVPQWFSSLLPCRAGQLQQPRGPAGPAWSPRPPLSAPTLADGWRAAPTNPTQGPALDDDDDDAEPIPSEGTRQPLTPRARPMGQPWRPESSHQAFQKATPAPPSARARQGSAPRARGPPPSAELVCTIGAAVGPAAPVPPRFELTCAFARGRDVGTLPRAAKTVAVQGDRLQVVGRGHQPGFFEGLLGGEAGPLRFVSRSHFTLEPVEGPHGAEIRLTNLSGNPLHVAGRRVAQNGQAALRLPAGIDFLESTGAGSAAPELFLRLLMEEAERSPAPL